MHNHLVKRRRAVPRRRRLFVEPLEARHLMAGATLGGVVFTDLNKNTIHEANEPPVAAVTVYIDTNDNKIQDAGEPTTTTDNNGRYTFTGLAAGNYVVRATFDPSFTQTAPPLTPTGPDRLFVADVFQDKISELNPVTGAVIHSFTAPYRSQIFMGLAFDGKFLYFASNDNDILFKLNPDTGAVISQTLLPARSVEGMAMLNGLLYVNQGVGAPILVYNPTTGTIANQLTLTGVSCCIVHGVGAIQNPNALLEVTLGSKVVEIDPGSGVGRTTFSELIFAPYSLTSVGQNIYIGDSNGRIDVYSRSGAFQRGFAGEPAVFGIAGLAGGTDNAQRITVGTNQLKLGVDFGTTQPGDFPPTPAGDTYGTLVNTPLHIAAPGVLKNDTDADNATLTVVKDSSPQFGTLTFNTDGSFTYIPSSGFRGNDSFNYHVSDGRESSPSVTVTIEVGSGVTLTESGSSTIVSEDGTTDDYTIALDTVPTGPVQVAVNAGSSTLVSSDGVSFFNTVTLTFSDRTPQTITVKAIDDSIIQGKHTSIIKQSVTGTVVDPNYPISLPIPSVSAAISDDDAPFQNPTNPLDVNNNGVVSPSDALILINFINAFGGFSLVKGQGPIPDPLGLGQGKALFVDVAADNNLAASDVIAVINYLNAQQTSGGEGEEGDAAALPPSDTDNSTAFQSAVNDASANLLALIAMDTAADSRRRK